MLKLNRGICFIAICLLLCLPAAAQDDANPLLDMLKLVPDNEQTRAGIPLASYADYRAIEQARGIESPLTKADFDNRSDRSSLWIAATNGVMSGMLLNYFKQYLDGMEQVVGFSWFDVDRALTFGQPPSTGNILMGNFDADAIASAFEAREFTQENQDDIVVWCGPSGCDDGLRLNLVKRNPANPFGGEFGREEPFAVLRADTVADSADYGVLSAIVDSSQGKQPSLADDPNVQTAVTVLADKGTLRQIQFFNGADVGNYGDQVATEGEPPELLPVYSLAFFADTFAGDEQSALIGLVYDDEQLANSAAALMVDHLQMAESMRVQRPFLEIIEARGGQITGATVETDSVTGKFIALLDIRYPMPPNEKQDNEYVASSLVFKLLIDSIYSRDASWLAADYTAPQ